jgi:hypothetical protein
MPLPNLPEVGRPAPGRNRRSSVDLGASDLRKSGS